MLALVVEHGQHRVVAALDSLVEDAVRRYGARRVNAALPGRRHRRGDFVGLLVAQQTAVAVVGIQAGRRNARVGEAPLDEGVVG